jgi:hypothetical protein
MECKMAIRTPSFNAANLPSMTIRLLGTNGITLTNPLSTFLNTVNGYTQIAIQNMSNGASASSDLIAYANNNANDTTGFVDAGFTSSAYADSSYTITGPNDAYLFGSCVAGSGNNGNLVICTDSSGARNDIIFGTNGFLVANIRFKMKKGGQFKYIPLASAPVDNVEEGDTYYDSTLHKLRVRTAAAWETVTSA